MVLRRESATGIRWLVLLSAALLAFSALAAPVQYSFTTNATPNPGPPFPYTFSGPVTGTFSYDSSAQFFTTNPDGSFIYRGFTPSSVTGLPTAVSNLSGGIESFSFSDVSGIAQVGNDTFTFPIANVKSDFFQLQFDPSLGSTSARNLTGFHVAGYTLFDVRMFWIEGQQTPELIADFLTNQNLLSILPSFHGRLALDFLQDGTQSVTSSVFFDGLQVQGVPEPGVVALALLALAMLAIWPRREWMSQYINP